MVQKLSQWTTFLEKEFSIIAMLYVNMRNFIQLTKTKQTIFLYIFPQSVRRFSLGFSIFSLFTSTNCQCVTLNLNISEGQTFRILISTLGCSKLSIFSLVSCLYGVIFHLTKKPKLD